MKKPRILLLRPPDASLSEHMYPSIILAHIPIIDVVPEPDALEKIKQWLPRCDWLVLTSPRTPRMLTELKTELASSGIRVAVVGAKTANALRVQLGIEPHLVPRDYRGLSLALELVEAGAKCALLARSEKAVRELPEALERRGVKVVEVPIYRVEPLHDMAAAAAKIADSFDYVVFTSPSITVTFTAHYPRPSKPFFTPVAIGPTTRRALLSHGYPEPLMPQRYTMEDVLQLILEHYRGMKGRV